VIFTISAALPFGLNAVGLIIGAALIARIPAARRPAGARPSARAFLSEVPGGLRWLWRSAFVRSIIVTDAGLTFFTQMWVPLLVLLIRHFEHRALQVLALAATAAAVLALAATAAAVLALAATAAAVLVLTLRQRLVPPELLGRVNSASRTLSTSAVPLGALAGGAIAGILGLRASFWFSGAAVAVLTVTFRLTPPTVRGPAARDQGWAG
jgi:hypothetical protein